MSTCKAVLFGSILNDVNESIYWANLEMQKQMNKKAQIIQRHRIMNCTISTKTKIAIAHNIIRIIYKEIIRREI